MTTVLDPSASAPEGHLVVGPELTAELSAGRIRLLGDIDIANSAAFRTLVTREGRKVDDAIVLDLTDLRFLDSSALGTLYTLSRETDFSFKLEVRQGSLVERVLNLGGLERALTIVRFPAA